MKEESARKALLANLRRGVGKQPGELPALWGILFEDFPEEWLGDERQAGREEWAVYTALTLFALHQQGKELPQQPMHQKGQTLGRALRKLTEKIDAAEQSDHGEERVLRRFRQMASAGNLQGLTHHMRGLVHLLRARDLPLDYAALAKDLYGYQQCAGIASVQRRWAEDFYRTSGKQTEEQQAERKEEEA